MVAEIIVYILYQKSRDKLSSKIDKIEKYVFSSFLNSLVSVMNLMSTVGLFQALGTATENARTRLVLLNEEKLILHK